jgi:hypothetical protein
MKHAILALPLTALCGQHSSDFPMSLHQLLCLQRKLQWNLPVMRSSVQRSCVMVALTLLLVTTMTQADSIAEAAECDVVSVLSTDASGRVMVESSLEALPDWTAVSVGEPLTMKHHMPLSLGLDAPDNLLCEMVDPQAQAALVNYHFLLKYPGAKSRCPYPVHPSHELYVCNLPNGCIAYLRMQEGAEATSVLAGCGAQRFEFERVSPYEFAKAQISGEDPLTDTSNLIIEYRIAEQDCRSLIAFEEGTGRLAELVNAARLVAELLEVYKERNVAYPGTLCQLYTGPDRVIAAIPRNPFEFQQNLCDSEVALPRPRGAVSYISQKVDGRIAGYWLAVLADGEPAQPKLALPEGEAVPLRAVEWIEAHP